MEPVLSTVSCHENVSTHSRILPLVREEGASKHERRDQPAGDEESRVSGMKITACLSDNWIIMRER